MMTTRRQIFLDNNATTPTDERVLEAMLPYFREVYANPGSKHLFGLTVEEKVAEAREQIAALIQAKPREIIFTSGATEAINLGIKGLTTSDKKHIITVDTEHRAVLDTCLYMESLGYDLTLLPVETDGRIDLASLEKAFRPDTFLVCIMMANNETGVLQSISEIARIVHERQALLLCDATQAVGKIPVDVKKLGIDLLPLSAHKFYGPKGTGALYCASHVKLTPQIHGGQQQNGVRSGTLNVPGIIGMAKASEIAAKEMAPEIERIGSLRNKLESALLTLDGTKLNGNKAHRLHTTTNISFSGVSSEQLIVALKNISVSSGSACQNVTSRPSHVLKSMGLTDEEALASIRFGLGRFTTEEDIDYAIGTISEAVETLRKKNQD